MYIAQNTRVSSVGVLGKIYFKLRLDICSLFLRHFYPVKEKNQIIVDLLRHISIWLLLVGAFLCLSTGVVLADDRMDLRLKHKPISSRMAVPRLALGTLKEKEKETELQVVKKRVSNKKARTRVKKSDRQRKKKTKRVVASQ